MKNLLVFEDDKDCADLVKHIFKKKGYNVSLKYVVDNYVQDIAFHQPHVILLDLRIPSIGGEIICRNIKEAYDIPVVMYSADHDLPDIAERANADDWVRKPFKLADIYEAVEAQFQKLTDDSEIKEPGTDIKRKV